MQQINPYLLPFGIKQNNASKCWPGKLAVIVSSVEKKKYILVKQRVCVLCLGEYPRPPPSFCSLQHCRKSAYDCSQFCYINNAICGQQYNDLHAHMLHVVQITAYLHPAFLLPRILTSTNTKSADSGVYTGKTETCSASCYISYI